MPKFKSTEASLYNGISQQSPELRLPSQVTDAVNANMTLSRGVEMRPPAEVIAEESGSFSADSLVHAINNTADASYILVIAGDASTLGNKIYDTNGDEFPIVFQDAAAQAYLETVDASSNFIPSEALQLSSILDYTFVCNKNVTPAMTANIKPDINVDTGYIWVKNGVQQVVRTINVGGNSITDPKDSNNDTERVIDHFIANAPSGYTITEISKAVIKIVKNDGTSFTLTATDSYADTTMAACQPSGCKIEDLPPVAADGEIVRIVIEDNNDVEYFLEYDEDTKSWSEVTAPGEAFEIDANTMPHAFVRKQDDASGTATGTPDQIYFELERLEWADRTTGSNDSSPLPSFIGKPIRDAFFFKNRLGFIAGDGVVLSATDDIFRFFPNTIKEVLDDDPIDTPVSSSRNVTLQHVAPFPESLIIVGDNEQFTLGSGGKAFTPENAVLDPTTAYSADPNVPPVAVGSTLYFVAPQSSYAAIREYSVQPDTLVTDAADITAHVPRLISNTLKQLISENNLEYLFLINNEDYSSEGNELIVYKFYWQGNEKVQSAWLKWNFWFNPLGGTTLNGKLYLIGTEFIGGSPNTVLVEINLSDRAPVVLGAETTPYKSTRPYIDRQVTLNGTPDEQENTIVIPVTAEQYAYPEIDDATPVVVDRITGVAYTFISRYQQGGNYYLVLGKPDYLTGVDLTFDDTILGSYTLGGVPATTIDEAFPYTLPATLT